MKNKTEEKKPRNIYKITTIVLIVIIILMLLVGIGNVRDVFGIRINSCSNGELPLRDDGNMGVMESNGLLDSMDETIANLLEEGKNGIDDSAMNNGIMSMNAVPYFKSASAEGNLLIENVDNGNKNMHVAIFLKDLDGEKIYETKKLMPPDSHIENDELDLRLDPGEYPVKALFKWFDPDTGKLFGAGCLNITISIGDTKG